LFSNEEKIPISPIPLQYTLRVIDTNEKTGIKKIDKRKKKGNICYAVFDDEKLVHISWIFKNHLFARQLGFKHALTIGRCATIESYRGQGIYPAVLSIIQKNYINTQLIIFVRVSNMSSIRGIMKAGFQKMLRFKILRLFGLELAIKCRHL